MNLETITSITQVLIFLNSIVLYPIFKFVFAVDRRLTVLETKDKLK